MKTEGVTNRPVSGLLKILIVDHQATFPHLNIMGFIMIKRWNPPFKQLLGFTLNIGIHILT